MTEADDKEVAVGKGSSARQKLEKILEAAWARNAFHTVVMDMTSVVDYTDLFVLLSGRSRVHVLAIADNIVEELKREGISPLSHEGRHAGTWVLLDYGDVVVHVFQSQTRATYDLESLWADANRMPVEEPVWVKEFARREADFDAFGSAE